MKSDYPHFTVQIQKCRIILIYSNLKPLCHSYRGLTLCRWLSWIQPGSPQLGCSLHSHHGYRTSSPAWCLPGGSQCQLWWELLHRSSSRWQWGMGHLWWWPSVWCECQPWPSPRGSFRHPESALGALMVTVVEKETRNINRRFSEIDWPLTL